MNNKPKKKKKSNQPHHNHVNMQQAKLNNQSHHNQHNLLQKLKYIKSLNPIQYLNKNLQTRFK